MKKPEKIKLKKVNLIEDLKDFTALLLNNDYKVLIREGSNSYIIFFKGNKTFYVQQNLYKFGYDFSVSYKPTKNYGSGYQFKDRQGLNLDILFDLNDYAEQIYNELPVKQYNDINDYFNCQLYKNKYKQVIK